MASVRNCQKFLHVRQNQSLVAPRWTWRQAKAGPTRNDGKVSVITHLRGKRSDYADVIAARAGQDENM